jgi:ABC-type lipoprotein release transport system permease subunit
LIGRKFLTTVAHDLRRHWRHFAAASVGVVLGVAALVFFLSLGLRMRDLLLVQVYPADHIEVVPRSVDIDVLALRLDLGRDTLDAAALAKLKAVAGVDAVYPKMRLTVPALATGGASLFGAGMQTEIVADGIDPALVANEVGEGFHEIDEKNGISDAPCTRDADCGDESYCDQGARPAQCRPYVPVLVSPYVVELYNGAFRRAYRLPKLNPDALRGLRFEMIFGASTFRPSSTAVIRERMRLVGVSSRAIPLGVTLPVGHVRRLNAALDSAAAGERYHSAILELRSNEDLPSVVQAVEAAGMNVRDRGAHRAALVTAVVMVVLGLVGGALIAMSGAHIMHVFYLVVVVRRREIALLRAVGARRGDIRALLLVEAAFVGLAAGSLGVLAAIAAAHVVDLLAASRIPDFPFKPESFFTVSPWLVASALAVAVLACVAGALPSAARAAAGDPADGLAGL